MKAYEKRNNGPNFHLSAIVVAGIFSQLASTWASGPAARLWIELYPESQSGDPVVLVCEGQRFVPPQSLDALEQEDLSTPRRAMRTAFHKLKTGDAEGYYSLFAPGERKGFVALEDPSTRPVAARLSAEIRYGEYVVLVVDYQMQTAPNVTLTYSLRKEGERWIFSDKLGDEDAMGLLLLWSLKKWPGQKMVTLLRTVGRARPDGWVEEIVGLGGGEDSVSPVLLRYRGAAYHEPARSIAIDRPIQQIRQQEPAETIDAVYSAVHFADAKLLIDLLAPSERDKPHGHIVGVTESLREYVEKRTPLLPQLAKQIVRAEITKIVHYGLYCIVLTQNITVDGVKVPDFLVLRREANKWFISDKLNQQGGDMVLTLFLGKKGSYSTAYPKILPSTSWDPQGQLRSL